MLSGWMPYMIFQKEADTEIKQVVYQSYRIYVVSMQVGMEFL